MHELLPERLDLLLLHSSLAERDNGLVSLAVRRLGKIMAQQARLLKYVTEIDESVEREDLVHVVHSRAEVQVLRQVFHDITSLLMALHILFVALRVLRTELALDHVRERVGQLGLASEDSAHERRSLYANGIDRAEVCCVEAALDEALDVKLEVEPDAFEDHRRRYPRVHRLPTDVVL